ncbi:hypothetical protein KKH27_07165 [bacterium]|nr:hypothetical protein [bacterium]MBU1985100.1 hypothetical protein [bacterium]
MPTENITEAIRIFIGNRADFYRTILSRIPDPQLREHLRAAVEKWLETGGMPQVQIPGLAVDDELIGGLLLRDIFKKPRYGFALARTAISFEEALARAEQVEEAGLLFFGTLSENAADRRGEYEPFVEAHRGCMASLLRLNDSVRYRKLPLPGNI